MSDREELSLGARMRAVADDMKKFHSFLDVKKGEGEFDIDIFQPTLQSPFLGTLKISQNFGLLDGRTQAESYRAAIVWVYLLLLCVEWCDLECGLGQELWIEWTTGDLKDEHLRHFLQKKAEEAADSFIAEGVAAEEGRG